jgi:ABC-type transporter Mla MlaB component
MTTRRKPGSLRKKPAAPKKATASRARASGPARRVAASKPARLEKSAALAAFPADCTIAQSEDMKARLAPLLTKPARVTLDLSNIRRVDTAALQVFTVFIRERRTAGRDVECKGASEAFLVTAEVLGLRALFSPVIDDRLAAPAAGNA